MRRLLLALALLAQATLPASVRAQSVEERVDALVAARRFPEALPLQEELVRERVAGLGVRHPRTLDALARTGRLKLEAGDYADAYELLSRTLVLQRDVLGERHPATLRGMNDTGLALDKLGRYREALELHEKLLRLSTEALGERHPVTQSAMGNAARMYGELSRFGEALALQEKLLRIREETLGERAPLTLLAMNNLAATYGMVGRESLALELQRKLLARTTEALGERNPQTLVAMSNLAHLLQRSGRLDEALALRLRDHQLRFQVFGERHPMTLASMSNLAAAMEEAGQVTESLAVEEKVVALQAEVLGPDHPQALVAAGNLGGTYLRRGRFEDALRVHGEVLERRRRVLGAGHPDTLASTLALAEARAVSGRRDEAAAAARAYVDGVERLRVQPGLGSENRRALFRQYATGYRQFASWMARGGDVAGALHLSELSKARTLLEGMAQQRAGRAAGLPPSARDELDALDRQIGEIGQQMAQAQQPEQRQRLEATRNELVRQFERLQHRLRLEHPKYAQLSEVRIAGARELAALVAPDARLVSYMVVGDEVSAWVVDEQGQPRYTDLGRSPRLSSSVEAMRRALRYPGGVKELAAVEGARVARASGGGYVLLERGEPTPPGAVPIADLGELARHLSDALLAPLARELEGRRQWIVSPDGALAQLPFEVLPFGAEGQPAIASHDIHYTQSLSVYALSRARQKEYEGLQGRKSLFAMGDPQYEASAVRQASRAELTRTIVKVAQRPRPSGAIRQAEQLRELDDKWVQLPGTREEVLAVAKLFEGSADVHLGPAATEHALQELDKRGALRNYRYLLFSTHGYLSPVEPALSSVVLGLVNRGGGADGYVTAAEWPGYELRSDLLVLSACDTGVGPVVTGEGVMGLPYALFVAGNVNTVLSLWPVDDEATVPFMRALFERVKAGVPLARALSETKRELAGNRKGKGLTAPAYWAPFVLVGAG